MLAFLPRLNAFRHAGCFRRVLIPLDKPNRLICKDAVTFGRIPRACVLPDFSSPWNPSTSFHNTGFLGLGEIGQNSGMNTKGAYDFSREAIGNSDEWSSKTQDQPHQSYSVSGDQVNRQFQCNSQGMHHESSAGRLWADNDFATGGLTVMVAGTLLALSRKLIEIAWEMVKRHFILRVEFDSQDDSYRWIMQWMGDHPDFQNATTLSVSTTLRRFGSTVQEEDPAQPKIYFMPAPGAHMLRYQNHWMMIHRVRPGSAGGGSTPLPATGPIRENLQISLLGRNRAAVESLISEAREAALQKERARTTVYFTDQYGNWVRTASRVARPLGSVVLPGKQAQDLLRDCQSFMEKEAWYASHGIPYRRGYLLYGTPGTGKTSLVTALAGSLGLSIYVINLSSRVLTDEMLCELMANAAAKSILLLEDVDAAFNHREGANTLQGSVTFSGLLNAIDGVAAQEGRLLFLTTNHVDKLDPALIRPGRIDMKVRFEFATHDQIEQFVKGFYKEEHCSEAEFSSVNELVQAIPGDKITIAQLQGFLMQHRTNPHSALKNLSALCE